MIFRAGFFLEFPFLMIRLLYIIIGSVSLAIGIIGIVVPGLPTTVFLLIAAAMYAKGSQRFYSALINSRFLGAYIRNFQKGMSIHEKIRANSMMWGMILISAIFFIESMTVKAILIIVGFIGTTAMGFVKVRRE